MTQDTSPHSFPTLLVSDNLDELLSKRRQSCVQVEVKFSDSRELGERHLGQHRRVLSCLSRITFCQNVDCSFGEKQYNITGQDQSKYISIIFWILAIQSSSSSLSEVKLTILGNRSRSAYSTTYSTTSSGNDHFNQFLLSSNING